uniref:Uncharacterized protein n=2 Tax=viral metagenome TaxID=1070528 RepID=A0A6M3M8C6_9ZZZZ
MKAQDPAAMEVRKAHVKETRRLLLRDDAYIPWLEAELFDACNELDKQTARTAELGSNIREMAKAVHAQANAIDGAMPSHATGMRSAARAFLALVDEVDL